MTKERKEELQRLADAAMPGPWGVSKSLMGEHERITTFDGAVTVLSFHDFDDDDLTFVLASRTAVPELLDALATADAENDALRNIARDLHWMARRYADNRQSYSTSLFNGHTRDLLRLGVPLNPTGDETIWARDMMGRNYDGLSDEEAAMGGPPDGTYNWHHNEDVEAERATNAELRARIMDLEDLRKGAENRAEYEELRAERCSGLLDEARARIVEMEGED